MKTKKRRTHAPPSQQTKPKTGHAAFLALQPLKAQLKTNHAKISIVPAQPTPPTDAECFARAMQSVRPLPDRHEYQPPLLSHLTPPRLPTQAHSETPRTEAYCFSDFEPALPAVDAEDALHYQHSDAPKDALKKLKRQTWQIRAALDLHGLSQDYAKTKLADFLRDAVQEGWRCVCVIHGKGLSSKHNAPVLKQKTRDWLMQHPSVLAFCSSPERGGGRGAVWVLLRCTVWRNVR